MLALMNANEIFTALIQYKDYKHILNLKEKPIEIIDTTRAMTQWSVFKKKIGLYRCYFPFKL